VKANTGLTSGFGTFKLYYDYNQQNLGLVEEEAIESIPERGRNCQIYYQQLNTHLLSSQNKIYFSKSRLDVNAAFQNTELIHFGEENEYELQMKLGTLSYETRFYLPSGKNSEYILGFQGINQRNMNLNNRETILLPDALTQNYSLFGLVQLNPIEKLKIQTGLRYDIKDITTEAIGEESSIDFRPALNKNYGSFSGSAGATYNFSDKFLLRTNFAAAFRTPNLAELTSNGQHETRYELGDNNLIPEQSLEFDLSLHYHVENFTFDLAGFYNRIDNYIFISPTGDTTATGIYVYKYMQANSVLTGGEAGIHFHPKMLQWFHFETTFAHVSGIMENDEYLPFIPADKLNIELRAQDGNFWIFKDAFFTIATNIAFEQNQIAADETPTDNYVIVNASAGAYFKINKQMISFSLGVNNLFDQKYIDHLSTLKEVNMFNPGRNIYLNLKIPFQLK
jgi:iron complex outermembrane receptor protein